MAAYRRVDDLRSPAGCLYTGISSGPNARYRVWEAFTFFILCFTLRLFDIVKQSRRLLFHTPTLSDFTDDDVSAKDFWVHVRYTMIG